ncbi:MULTISPECIES: helix-turn-helix domain-containing protein [Lactobacillaceae]|uniref:XRE family transcriptional regulator n=1 Tax=Acetilactobacillus jinshanensis TaxID=1720083 RepID=A0A4P6ZJI4_9LACO|nr:helix-turn-helix transcriptional regulator [Acetilactobacillus jinshanensis]QBP17627.1 XRE family transcriptional regulator [Acetilactobacillus jinshanensis]URL61829.1 helix-turn-helix transcriptional regulator [uncultured bacterium]
MIEFPKQLKSYRQQRGLSQEGLAQQVHVTRQAVSKWEAGEASPDIKSLVRLASIFNITLDNLVLGQSMSTNTKIDSSKFIYDPIKNRYVRNAKNMNIYEFLIHYWWIAVILLIVFGSVIHSFF